MAIPNILTNWLTLLKQAAARYGDTPSGFSGDVVKATKEIIKGEHTPYQASIPSQRAYIFGEKHFPASTHEPVFNPSLPQYDVSFGMDTLYVPKQDSVIFMQNLNNKGVTRQGERLVRFPNGSVNLLFSKDSPKFFYDAGRHSFTPKIDENGKVVAQLDDIYDFEGDPQNYIDAYSTHDSNQSPSWLRKAAVKGMQFIGTPYEVHQTVPVIFIDNFEQTSDEYVDDRNMLTNILKTFGKEFKKPIEQLTDSEVASALQNRHLKGDDLIREWESKGLLLKKGNKIHVKGAESYKQGGKLSYLDIF